MKKEIGKNARHILSITVPCMGILSVLMIIIGVLRLAYLAISGIVDGY